MADLLLTLTLPGDVARDVADLLLSRPDLATGFTASPAEGHGSAMPLVAPAELVGGHAPRTQIRLAGDEAALRQILALIKAELPRANVFYWLVPVIEMGRL